MLRCNGPLLDVGTGVIRPLCLLYNFNYGKGSILDERPQRLFSKTEMFYHGFRVPFETCLQLDDDDDRRHHSHFAQRFHLGTLEETVDQTFDQRIDCLPTSMLHGQVQELEDDSGSALEPPLRQSPERWDKKQAQDRAMLVLLAVSWLLWCTINAVRLCYMDRFRNAIWYYRYDDDDDSDDDDDDMLYERPFEEDWAKYISAAQREWLGLKRFNSVILMCVHISSHWRLSLADLVSHVEQEPSQYGLISTCMPSKNQSLAPPPPPHASRAS